MTASGGFDAATRQAIINAVLRTVDKNATAVAEQSIAYMEMADRLAKDWTEGAERASKYWDALDRAEQNLRYARNEIRNVLRYAYGPDGPPRRGMPVLEDRLRAQSLKHAEEAHAAIAALFPPPERASRRPGRPRTPALMQRAFGIYCALNIAGVPHRKRRAVIREVLDALGVDEAGVGAAIKQVDRHIKALSESKPTLD